MAAGIREWAHQGHCALSIIAYYSVLFSCRILTEACLCRAFLLARGGDPEMPSSLRVSMGHERADLTAGGIITSPGGASSLEQKLSVIPTQNASIRAAGHRV